MENSIPKVNNTETYSPKIKLKITILVILLMIIVALVIFLIFLLTNSQRYLTLSPGVIGEKTIEKKIFNGESSNEESEILDQRNSENERFKKNWGADFLPYSPDESINFVGFKITPLVIYEKLQSNWNSLLIIILLIIIMFYIIHKIKNKKKKNKILIRKTQLKNKIDKKSIKNKKNRGKNKN